MGWKLCVAAVSLAVAGTISVEAGGSKDEQASTTGAPIVISAQDLKAAYQADKKAANATYKHQPLVVFGYFDGVSGGLAHFASEAYCSMENRDAKNAMKEVPTGTYIVMAGKGFGHVSRDPSIRDCRRLHEGDELYVPEFQADAAEPSDSVPVQAQESPDPDPAPIVADNTEQKSDGSTEEPASNPDQRSEEATGLSEVTSATLELFRELYGFRNDPEFHRVGFAVAHQFNDWQVRLDDLTRERRSEQATAISEIGIAPGDLWTLAQDYMDNEGCASGNFTRDIEGRQIAASEVEATPCGGTTRESPDDQVRSDNQEVAVEPDPEPSVLEATEPEPLAMSELPEVPSEWRPVSYKLDGRDTTKMSDGLVHWVYIYLEGTPAMETMIATALQASLDVYREHGGDLVLIAVMEGPDENYPVETVTFHPGGCAPDDHCVAEVWDIDTDLEIPEVLLRSMVLPTREDVEAEASARETLKRQQAATQKAREERDNAAYDRCFNPWNGSHRQLVELVKENIDTPRSFKHVKTTAYLGDFPRPVIMQFDAQNVFGATIRVTVKAASNVDCSVSTLEVIEPDN